MTVKDFTEQFGYEILTCADKADKIEITGVYICDLLSMAMARVKDGNMWVTVHTNVNIVAVAYLTNAACIVIPENIEVEEITVSKAAEKGIIIIRAPHTSYEICVNYYLKSSELSHG
ncbi:hypothetical protein [Thermoclostridium stercorarium]|uniref:hypothetical protein n=1 Tax=Thermoclostridium stercorarium TaxID=1510 RepID=UPI0006D16DF8|nr:hypothetical protein [Thermoclostridium stercorarium]